MIVVHPERWTLAWLEAQAGYITESDAATVIADPSAENFKALVERLFLEWSAVPEDPDALERRFTFKTRGYPGIVSGLNWFRRLEIVSGGFSPSPGLVRADSPSWLAASPHALTFNSVVHVIPREYRRAWERARDKPIPRPLFAKAQVLMHVCERPYCDIVDYWDSRVNVFYDAVNRRRIDYDAAFIEGEFLPACAAVWSRVGQLHEQAFAGG